LYVPAATAKAAVSVRRFNILKRKHACSIIQLSNLLAVACATMRLQAACKLLAYLTPLN